MSMLATSTDLDVESTVHAALAPLDSLVLNS